MFIVKLMFLLLLLGIIKNIYHDIKGQAQFTTFWWLQARKLMHK